MEKYKIPCDLCKGEIAEYGGKTTLGCWAFLCEKCFKESGRDLVLGLAKKLQEAKK